MRQTYKTTVVFLLLAISTISAASADAGTPLILASLFQMLLGSLFIGIGEGYLISWRYKSAAFKSVLIMLANYASTWLGLILVGVFFPEMAASQFTDSPLPAHVTLASDLGCVAILFTVTTIIEWPFCHFVLREKHKNSKTESVLRSLKASILAQSASYAILLPIYLKLRTLEAGW